MIIQNVKGGYDFLPKQQKIRNYINGVLRSTFERYGYKYNDYGKLSNHINSRKFYNFVKTNSCNIATAKVPLIHLEEIKEIFNRGTTIWHIDNGAEPLNYNVKNMEV